MKKLAIAAIYIGAYLLLAACSPESASLVSAKPLPDNRVEIPQYDKIPEQSFEWITEDGGQSQLDFNPQVDILFVADNSESMKQAQENLFKNMEAFTRGITRNKMIDYHIGVISVWDSSERFLTNKKDKYEMGDLQYIKDSKGQNYNRRYIVKTDATALLASSLKIGAIPYTDGGPEFEEMFSPLSAALDKSGRGAANEEFFRKDSQLVVIFLTDADDSSKNILPEEMAQKLIGFKDNRADKVAVYGVLVRPNDPDSVKDWDLRVHPKYHPECFDMKAKTPKNLGICKGFGPERIEKLILSANRNVGTPDQIREKHIMSMVDPAKGPKFGERLSKIGDDITVKTLAKEIFLSQRPRVDENGALMVRVRYGNQVIPKKEQGGWLYNAENNSITLSGDINYNYIEGARFAVDLVPLTLAQ